MRKLIKKHIKESRFPEAKGRFWSVIEERLDKCCPSKLKGKTQVCEFKIDRRPKVLLKAWLWSTLEIFLNCSFPIMNNIFIIKTLGEYIERPKRKKKSVLQPKNIKTFEISYVELSFLFLNWVWYPEIVCGWIIKFIKFEISKWLIWKKTIPHILYVGMLLSSSLNSRDLKWDITKRWLFFLNK